MENIYLYQLPFTMIANNVDSLYDFNKAKDLEFELFEGEFFKEPEKLESDIDIFNKLDTLKVGYAQNNPPIL